MLYVEIILIVNNSKLVLKSNIQNYLLFKH